MSTRRVAIAALFFTIGYGAAASAVAPRCDRACLAKALDRYVAAVVKHDASAAPLAANFRYTENALEAKPGDGLWKTATGLGAVQRRYLDPVSGQAAYFGLIEEGADTAIAT